jgi:hypothetical protein
MTRAIPAFSCWLTLACGSRLAGSAGDAGPQEASEASADVTADHAAAATDGGSGPADAPGPPAGRAGFIEFETYLSPPGLASGDLYAAFEGIEFGDSNRCQQMSVGASCVLYSCLVRSPDAGPSPTAGVLTITGGNLDASVEVVATPPGEYNHKSVGPFFAPGAVLGASATGGDVPAFASQTIRGPATPHFTEPPLFTLIDGGAYLVDTSQDLTLAWSGGQAGSWAVFQALGRAKAPTVTYVWLYCQIDATAGDGVVPRAGLAALAGASFGWINVGLRNAAAFSAGDWSVAITATIWVTAPATFQ